MSLILTVSILLVLSLIAARLLRWRAPALAAQVCFAMACVGIALPFVEQALPGWRKPQLVYLHPATPTGPTTAAVPVPTARPPLHAAATSAQESPSKAADAIADATLLRWFWLAGAGLLLLHWLRELQHVRRHVRDAQRDPVLERKFSLLSRHPLQIRFSGGVAGAFLWHGHEAIVVMPESYRSLGSGRLRLVILHELAHHARCDNLRLGCLRLFRILWWFHPLAWWVERSGRDCAELAADDEVLQRKVDPDDYATVLAKLARTRARTHLDPVVGLAGLGLRARLRRLLDPPKRMPAFAGGMVLVALALAGASVAAVDVRLAREAGDDWVWSMRTSLTPHRFEDLPDRRLQIATFYDGEDAGNAALAIELGDETGRTRWYSLPALIKFDRGARRVELELAPGIRPSGRLRVQGMTPDGVVDGVAVGMAWREPGGSPAFRRTRALEDGEVPRTICSWPLALTSERMRDEGRRIEHWEMDTLQRLLCGAELVENGLVSI